MGNGVGGWEKEEKEENGNDWDKNQGRWDEKMERKKEKNKIKAR